MVGYVVRRGLLTPTFNVSPSVLVISEDHDVECGVVTTDVID